MVCLSSVRNCKLLQVGRRPLAGHGLWLAGILPAGLLVNVIRHEVSKDYLTIAFLSWMILCSLGLILWKLIKLNGRNGSGYLGSIGVAGAVTALVISFVIGQNPLIAVAGGLLVTFVVQWIFCGLMRCLPKSFTIGEAAVVTQGLTLFLFKSLAIDFPKAVVMRGEGQEQSDELAITRIIELGVLMIFLLIGLMKILGKRIQNLFLFTALLGLTVLAIIITPITQPIPILFVVEYLLDDPGKIIVLVIFGVLILATGAFCHYHTASGRPTSTALRKSFHLVIVIVFLIGVVYQRLVLFLGSGVAFSIILLLEAVRIGKVEYLSPILDVTVKSFVDGQDSGIIALTPIYLLIGSAAPLFLSPVAIEGGRDLVLPLLSGVLSVGVGDSFAGFVGSLYGRHVWQGSRKSIEGTVANAISQLLFIGLLKWTEILPTWMTVIEYLICLCGVITNAIVEAKTDQLDNLVVPLVTFVIFSWI